MKRRGGSGSYSTIIIRCSFMACQEEGRKQRIVFLTDECMFDEI